MGSPALRHLTVATPEQANRDYESGDLLVDFPWTPRRVNSPEMKLLYAIIIDAWDQVASFRRVSPGSPRGREVAREARDVFRWIEGHTESGPRIFSFESVCGHLGWDAAQVRRAFYGNVQHIGLGQQGTRAKIRLRRRRRPERGTRAATRAAGVIAETERMTA